MEKQSGYTIKILRKDRDTEYTIYDYFLKKKSDIEHQLVARYTLQQKRIAKRKK